MVLHGPSMYASTAAVIELVALLPDNSSVLLFENGAVNSAFGVIPLRYSWEGEGLTTAKAEGRRLEIETANLIPFIKEGLEVDYMGWPCCCDSKTKVWWSGGTAMMSCYICGATPLELAKRFCKKFKKPNRKTFTYGIGSLHIRLRTFDWLVKFATHRDFKNRSAR